MSDYQTYYHNKLQYLNLQILQSGGKEEYKISIKQPWFDFIKSGKKTVEGRLNKGLFNRVQQGDNIIWQHNGNECKVRIMYRNVYKSFKDMLENEKLKNVLPNISNIEDGIKIYHQYYPEIKDKERKFGVVAIGMELQNDKVIETKTHEGKLVSPHYEDILNGSKIYEVRVNDKKRQSMNVGDRWVFRHMDDPSLPPIYTKIIQKDLFDSFEQAIEDVGIENVLPNATSLEDGIKMYESFPHKEGSYKDGAKKYGVVRFKIAVEV